VRTRSTVSDEVIGRPDTAAIFVKLRKMIAADTQQTDTILGTIAVAAHSLTGATGAAIAMPRDGAVICVGRSGETAPELGDRLNVDSGISGECLRTGMILRCDDASRDFHVNAEVCRKLGLQSIAVVPLRGQEGRVGVLEAFSTQSYAFTEEKMDLLGRLAGLAEAAWARGAVAEGAAEAEVPYQVPSEVRDEAPSEVRAEEQSEELPLASALVPVARVREVLGTGLYEEEEGAAEKWRYGTIASLALLVVFLLSVFGWRAWHKSSVPSRSNLPAASPQVAPTGSGTSAAGSLAWKRHAETPVSRPDAAPAAQAVTSTAVEIPNAVIRRRPKASPPPVPSGESADTPSDSVPDTGSVLQMAASRVGETGLGNALSTAPALPRLGVPVSQGVTGGTLLHKVQPAYPSEARHSHLEGVVALEAVITEQGQIEDLKVISGPPALAQAAVNAVSQWRYSPYMLNGKPIRKQTRVNITFKFAQ
jgi:TonB family protein